MSAFTIPGRLDGLNEYTSACRSSRYAGAEMKRKNQKICFRAIRRAEKLGKVSRPESFPVFVSVRWYEGNRRRDVDNITFAVKFILDAMVQAGVLPDDSREYVCSIQHQVLVDSSDPRIEVIF